MIAPRPQPATAPVVHIAPQPGRGTRLTMRGGQWSLAANVRGGHFAHPWRPSLAGLGLRLDKGLVDIYEPLIDGVPISGSEGKLAPVLKLDPKIANKVGESWVCVEVEAGPATAGDGGGPLVDAAGKRRLRDTLNDKSRVVIVHSAEPLSRDEAVGRTPLVQLVWRDGKPVRVFSVVHFNLRYQRVVGFGAVRHLFF